MAKAKVKDGKKRKNMRKMIGLFGIVALFAIALAAPAPALAAEPVAISIGSYTTYVNSNVTVPIEITNASAFAGGSAKIFFNPSIVNVQEVLAEDFGTPVANISNTNGFVHVAVSRATAVGKDNYASLASIKFKGVSKGITALNIANAYLNYENYTGVIPETSNGAIDIRTPSDTDADSGSGTDPHNGDGYTDSTAGAGTAAADDSEKEEEKVFSNEPTAINIGSYTAGMDSNLTVPVEITNASAAAGGSANISFNPSIVNVEEVLPGDFGTPIANINNAVGFVYIACALPTAVGKDKAKLASVRFKGISKGVTSLGIQDATLNDEHGKLITLETTSGGEIEVRTPISPPALTPTPTPFATTNERITTPPPAPGEHDSLFIMTIIIIVACLALVGGVIIQLKRRKT
jgi:hypothetical protein